MVDNYPRVPRDLVEIWLNDPTTKAFLQCTAWYQEQLSEARASSAFVGATHDKTIENLYRNLGAEEAAKFLTHPMHVLENYGIIREMDEDNAA